MGSGYHTDDLGFPTSEIFTSPQRISPQGNFALSHSPYLYTCRRFFVGSGYHTDDLGFPTSEIFTSPQRRISPLGGIALPSSLNGILGESNPPGA